MCFLYVYLKGTHVVNSCLESSRAAEESSNAWRDYVVFVNAVVWDFKSDLGQTWIQKHIVFVVIYSSKTV